MSERGQKQRLGSPATAPARSSPGRAAYIEYLVLDRLLALRTGALVTELAAFFEDEAVAMSDAELNAAVRRLVEVGAAHRSGPQVCASEVARYISSLPEALPEAC